MLARDRVRERIEIFAEGEYFKGGGDNDVTSRVEPWDAAKPHFERMYKLASEAYDATDRDPYPFDFIEGENTFDILARQQISFAAEQMSPDSIKTRLLGAKIVNGEFLDPSTNPMLTESINVGVDKASAALLEDVIPQVLDIAVRSGAYSGSATDIIIDRALESFSREALRATTGIYYENWVRERSLQASGVEILKAAEVMEFERGKLLMANADLYRSVRQLELDNLIKDFEDELKSHWRGMQEYDNIMVGGGFHADTTHDPSKQKNFLGSALQGAVGGASMGASVGGPPGAGVGAILGGIAGLLG